jgi:hypothetical protein
MEAKQIQKLTRQCEIGASFSWCNLRKINKSYEKTTDRLVFHGVTCVR